MSNPLFLCPSCHGLVRVRADKLDASPTCGRCKATLDTSGAPQQLDDAALERVVHSSPVPVLVDFYADWCGPCKALAPHLDALGREKAGQLLVVKVDTQQHQRYAGQLGVSGIPAVFLFKKGQILDQATGMRPKAFWEAWVAPHLAA